MGIALKKDYLSDDVILNNRDQKDIYRRKQEIDKKARLYDVNKQSKKIDNDIYIDDLENEGARLKREINVTKQKILNAKHKAILSKVDRAVDFNDALTANNLDEIRSVKDNAERYSKASTFAGLISAITTCVSIILSNGERMSSNLWLIGIIIGCAAVITASLLSNIEIKSFISYKNKFLDKIKKDSVVIFSIKCLAILAYTCYSIWTNFYFWGMFFDNVGKIMFSVFFDLVSIGLAFEADKNRNMEFSLDYIDSINSVFEDIDNDSDNNTVNYDSNDSFSNLEQLEDKDNLNQNSNVGPFGKNEKKNKMI